MKFIVFDTVGFSMQVALYLDGAVTTACEASFRRTSERLMPCIDELLCKANITLNELDFIACVIGPGSFTGIRIGVATARAFSQFTNKKVVGVTFLQVMTYNASENKNIVALSDASNSLCYASVFDKDHNQLTEPKVIAFSEIESFLNSLDYPFEVVVDNAIAKVIGDNYDCVVKNSDCSDLVGAVIAQFEKNGASNYNDIIPIYIRMSQAEADLQAKEASMKANG